VTAGAFATRPPAGAAQRTSRWRRSTLRRPGTTTRLQTSGRSSPGWSRWGRASPRRRPGGRGSPSRSCGTARATCWLAWDASHIRLPGRRPRGRRDGKNTVNINRERELLRQLRWLWPRKCRPLPHQQRHLTRTRQPHQSLDESGPFVRQARQELLAPRSAPGQYGRAMEMTELPRRASTYPGEKNRYISPPSGGHLSRGKAKTRRAWRRSGRVSPSSPSAVAGHAPSWPSCITCWTRAGTASG
jgi:hypothetical protein